MQNHIIEVDGVSSLRSEFIRELNSRIESLEQLLKRSVAEEDCCCELFGRCRRILDIAGLLDVDEVIACSNAFTQAERKFRERKDLTHIQSWIENIKSISLSEKNVISPKWNLKCVSDVNSQALPNIVHLALPKEHTSFLKNYFEKTAEQVNVVFDSNELLRSLDSAHHNTIIIDELWLGTLGVNIFDWAKQINNSISHSVIYFTNNIDFNKRLQAVRNKISLVYHAGYDENLIIQAVEKDFAEHEQRSGRLLIVSGDRELSGVIKYLLMQTGLTIDHYENPSDELLKRLRKNKYDLIIVDYYLDDIYGNELVMILRQDKSLAFVPVVYLYARTDIGCDIHDDVISGDSHVIDAYEPCNIVETINHVVRRSASAGKLGKYMADVQQDNENRRRVLDAHNIVSVSDLAGRIVDVNPKFCEISGYSRDELIGKNHRIINSCMHSKAFFKDMWETISSGQIWHGEICNRKKTGELYWVESTIVPLLDEKGQPYQYMSARTDVSHIKQIENDLRLSEDRLMRSQSFANIGTWDWDIQNGSLYWSPKVPPLFGYEEGEITINYESFLEAVHPDDRGLVVDGVAQCIRQGREYETEYRCVWKDGTVRWMLERGDVVRNENGEPLHMLGVVMDITERKKAELQSKKQQSLLDLLRNGLGRYIRNNNINEAADYMLEGLLELTESQYGIIGEVSYDESNKAYIKVHAISNMAWDQKAMDFYSRHYKEGMEFRRLDNLIGYGLKSGQPVISDDPMNDSRRGGLPDGHPPIDSFLSVPVYHGNNMIAIYCMANKKSGYDESIIEFLKPFNVTYSSIVNADRMASLQTQTLTELKVSRQEAIDANRAKSHFLSNMSHELRTPLNAILGFGQLLEMNLEQNLSLQQLDNVSEIIKAGQHLLSLINEVLDLTKIEAGKVDLHMEPVAVLDTVVDCINIIYPLAEQKNIRIHVANDNKFSHQVNVMADSLRLRQVMLNLLSNSIKYNKTNGEVLVSVDVNEGNKVRINIKDTGYGISVNQQNKVFESFNRLGAEKREIEGTGIGLVICKKIVEIMGGEMGFTSVPDEGSCFWVEFEATNEVANTFSEEFASHVEVISDTDSVTATKKVIYVEDNLANIRLMASLFEGLENIELIKIHESRLAMDKIRDQKPDIVLLDINMPGIDGYQILREIKNSPGLCNTTVIAVSANAMPREIEKGLRLGFDEYVTKPVAVPRFLKMIKRRLQRN